MLRRARFGERIRRTRRQGRLGGVDGLLLWLRLDYGQATIRRQPLDVLLRRYHLLSRHHASLNAAFPTPTLDMIVVNVRAALGAVHVRAFRLAAVATPLHVRDEVDALLNWFRRFPPARGSPCVSAPPSSANGCPGVPAAVVSKPHTCSSGTHELRHSTRRRHRVGTARIGGRPIPNRPPSTLPITRPQGGKDQRRGAPRRGRGRRAALTRTPTVRATRRVTACIIPSAVQTSATASSRPLTWPGPRAIRT